MFQNGIACDYPGRTLTVLAEWSLSPLRWLVLNNKIHFQSNTIAVTGFTETVPNLKLMESLELVFRISGKTSFIASCDYYSSSSSQTSRLTQANVASVWMLRNGKNLFLKCSNLFNCRGYTYCTNGPLVQSTCSYLLRPMSIVVGIDFSLMSGSR